MGGGKQRINGIMALEKNNGRISCHTYMRGENNLNGCGYQVPKKSLHCDLQVFVAEKKKKTVPFQSCRARSHKQL